MAKFEFDRIVLINLDKRKDRLGAFKAKIEEIPTLQNYVRCRAVHGDTVTVPLVFISGGGAWGCRQSHLRVLEDAMMDGIDKLLVLEDDVRFVPNFLEKSIEFMKKVPDDWDLLMLGGQDMGAPAVTGIDGVARSLNTQRTHAYAIRGLKAMQDLYRLWARSDRHIDHLFGEFQRTCNAYQPVPFLCGQDQTASDISGRNDAIRYWNTPELVANQENIPINLLMTTRAVAESARVLGCHWGYHRDEVTGRDIGLMKIHIVGMPADDVKRWCDVIVAEAVESEGVPCIWFGNEMTPSQISSKVERPVNVVAADTVQEVVRQLPQLLPAWMATQIVWCWRGEGQEMLEGLRHFGFHRGSWTDPVTGLDNGVRGAVEVPGKYHLMRQIVRQLTSEAGLIPYGRALIAHPHLNVEAVRAEMGDRKVVELQGTTIGELRKAETEALKLALEMYKAGK